MRQIVLQVISHVIDSMNGQRFHRYKLKLMSGTNVYETDGCSYYDEVIETGHIIDCMRIVGKLSGAEMCKLYYEQDNENRSESIKNKPIVHKKREKVTEKCNIVHEKRIENEQLCLF